MKGKNRVRKGIKGDMERPRLSVFRSARFIYGQIIDDEKGRTLVSFSAKNLKEAKGKKKSEIAALVGEGLAKLAVTQKIKKIVFDRRGYKYHGRVKALAEGARKGGLKF